MFKRYRSIAKEAALELKSKGFTKGSRALLKQHGWKLVALVFTTYLVRDLTLYIILPWFIAQRLVLE